MHNKNSDALGRERQEKSSSIVWTMLLLKNASNCWTLQSGKYRLEDLNLHSQRELDFEKSESRRWLNVSTRLFANETTLTIGKRVLQVEAKKSNKKRYLLKAIWAKTVRMKSEAKRKQHMGSLLSTASCRQRMLFRSQIFWDDSQVEHALSQLVIPVLYAP